MIKSLPFAQFQSRFTPTGFDIPLIPNQTDVTPLTPYRVEYLGHNSASYITKPVLGGYLGLETLDKARIAADTLADSFNEHLDQIVALNNLSEMLGMETLAEGEIHFAIRISEGDEVLFDTKESEFTDYYEGEA